MDPSDFLSYHWLKFTYIVPSSHQSKYTGTSIEVAYDEALTYITISITKLMLLKNLFVFLISTHDFPKSIGNQYISDRYTDR